MARIKLNLKRIDPVKAGIIYGSINFLITLIVFLPIILLFSLTGMSGDVGMVSILGSSIFLLLLPVISGLGGFIIGLIGTALLNFILSKTKGLDVEFDGADMEISQIGEDNVTF